MEGPPGVPVGDILYTLGTESVVTVGQEPGVLKNIQTHSAGQGLLL